MGLLALLFLVSSFSTLFSVYKGKMRCARYINKTTHVVFCFPAQQGKSANVGTVRDGANFKNKLMGVMVYF
jgi:hypothetical protein